MLNFAFTDVQCERWFVCRGWIPLATAGESSWRRFYPQEERPEGKVVGQRHPAFLTTTNHALGPPSLNEKSFRSGRTSNRDGTILSTAHPSAKASRISFADTLRGPCVSGSSSLKQSRNNRPPGLRTVASPSR